MPTHLNYSTPVLMPEPTLQPLPDLNDLFLKTNNVQYYLTITKTKSQEFLRYFTITLYLVSTYISMDMGNPLNCDFSI